MLTLSRLGAHLVERGSASLDELALHFDADRAAVRDALERLEAKGRVARCAKTAGCRGCSGCSCLVSEIWEAREGRAATGARMPRPVKGRSNP